MYNASLLQDPAIRRQARKITTKQKHTRTNHGTSQRTAEIGHTCVKVLSNLMSKLPNTTTIKSGKISEALQ